MVKTIKNQQSVAKEEDELKEEIANLEVDSEDEEESVESINEIEELEKKTKEIKDDFAKYYSQKGKKINWIETMDITSDEPMDQELNPDDDIKRELLFINLAKENAIKGMIQLKKLGQKINRPDDFFAEMLKSDEQMTLVKKQIIKEQQYIQKFEKRKQQLQNIKFSKKLKDMKNKEMGTNKRNLEEGLKQWKEHIKSAPKDYKNIDKFIGGKKRKKINVNEIKRRNAMQNNREKRDNQHFRKNKKRPGKVKRMMNRNYKNSLKGKKKK